MGIALGNEGKFDKAIEAFKKSITLILKIFILTLSWVML